MAIIAVIAAVVAVILVPGQPPRAGSLAWKFPTGAAIWSSPAVVNGVVYFGSEDHYVYALNAKTGKELWKYPTRGMVQSSPAVVDGVLYVGSDDGNVYALRTAPALSLTGRLIWSYFIGGQIWSPAVSSDGSMVYVGGSHGNVYALRTGPTVPKAEREARVFPSGPIRSGPVVVDNVVYFGSEPGDGYSGGVYAVKADGAPLWGYPAAGWVDSNPTLTVVDGVVYFGSHDGSLYELDADNGTRLRQYHVVVTGVVPDRADARPAVAGGVVYVGTDGGLYALKPSGASSFSALWRNPKDAFVVSGPAVVGSVVYVGGGDHYVYALDAAGHVRWSYRTGNRIFSSPVVSGNVVYIGSEDGKLYALNTGS